MLIFQTSGETWPAAFYSTFCDIEILEGSWTFSVISTQEMPFSPTIDSNDSFFDSGEEGPHILLIFSNGSP